MKEVSIFLKFSYETTREDACALDNTWM